VTGGYHVTEVKAGQFAALACGANPESWTEIFVQLWDIEECDRTHRALHLACDCPLQATASAMVSV
jgi:hypothetical protein